MLLRSFVVVVSLGLALVFTGCGSKPSAKSKQRTTAQDSSTIQLPPASKSVPQQLVEAQAALMAALEAGTLDQTGVHAFRLRDLTQALAASDPARYADPANRVRVASEALQQAAEQGDLGGARSQSATIEAALRLFHDAPDVSQLELPTQTMESRSVNLTGELIDPQCYFTHDGKGIDHISCAILCAKGGQDLAFLDVATGDIHPLIAIAHGEDPNRDLIAHIGKPVTIEGVLFARAHNHYLLIQSVVGAGTPTPSNPGSH